MNREEGILGGGAAVCESKEVTCDGYGEGREGWAGGGYSFIQPDLLSVHQVWLQVVGIEQGLTFW